LREWVDREIRSTEFDVQRYFRDAPLMIVGEGANEIQRNIIVQQLVSRGGLE
jgi:alkylation response protein AidB-like acyl-CoA dehydrogenase